MKTILVILLAISNCCIAQFTSDEIRDIKTCSQGCKIDYDEMEGIVWVKSGAVDIQQKGSMLSAFWSEVYIYYGIKKESGKTIVMPIRIVNTLGGTSWLFFNEITYLVGTKSEVKNGGGDRYKIMDSNVSRVTTGTLGIKESSDVIASTEILKFIKDQSEDAKPIKVRYSGETYFDAFTMFVGGFERNFKPLVSSWNLTSEKYK